MSDEKPKGSIEIADHLSADETLRLVRGVRLGILDQQMLQGPLLDSDSFAQFNTNLAELSKDATKEKQLQQEEKSADAIAAMAKAASEQLASSMGIAMFQRAGNEPIDVTGRGEALASIEGVATPVEGELEVNVPTRTYEEFQNTVGAELDRRRRGEAE